MTGLTDDFWKQSLVPQQTTTPDVVGIAPELVERMVVAIKAYVADNGTKLASGKSIYAELAELARLLPEPVDGDLLIAREIAADYHYRETGSPALAADIRNGNRDDGPGVVIALAALKHPRGRALERGEA